MQPVLIFTLLAFVGAIAFYNPQKQSLRDTAKTTLWGRLFSSKGTLIIGALLTLIASWSFNSAGMQILPTLAIVFGYSRTGFFDHQLYFQPLSSVFFHFNLVHLVANLSALLLVSAYERRVGFLRFMIVFLVSGLAAGLLDILFIGPNEISLGASGAIAGLAAGYALDKPNVPLKEWCRNSVLVVLGVLALSFLPQNTHYGPPLNVNWIVHLLGAGCAAIFVRFF